MDAQEVMHMTDYSKITALYINEDEPEPEEEMEDTK